MSKIIKQNKKGSLIVISGPSGSGKDSICERLREYNDNFWVSVSCTTRKPRIGEEEGINYYFKNNEEFEELIKNDDDINIEQIQIFVNYYDRKIK